MGLETGISKGTSANLAPGPLRRTRSAIRRSPEEDDEFGATREDIEHSPLLVRDNSIGDDGEDLVHPDAFWLRERAEWWQRPWYRRPSIYWLLFPYLLSTLAMGGILIPKLNLILGLLCREYYADKSLSLEIGGELDPQCRTPEVSAHASLFGLYGGLISGVMSAIIAPKMGALSDRVGRRPIMMLCNAGSLIGEIITIIAATYPQTFKIYWILVGYFIDGLTGSMMASMAVSHSYATDCTAPSKRNVVFGYFHGVLFTGIALGPLITAWVVKKTNSIIWMFYIALACHLFYISLLVLLIPESLPRKTQQIARERYRQERENHGSTRGWLMVTKGLFLNFFEPLKILYPRNDPIFSPAARRNLFLLASLDGIIFGVGTGAFTVIVLYSNFHFKWDTVQASLFISLVSIFRTLCLFLVLPTIAWFFRHRVRIIPGTGTNLYELSIIRFAIGMDVLGFLGYSIAGSGIMFMASGAVASMGGMGSPTLQAALTKHVPPDRIGQLLGAMALLHAIARVASPAIFNGLYSLTVGKFDQAVFLVLTVLFACAWGVSWMITSNVKLNWLDNEYLRRRAQRDDPNGVVDPAEEPLL